MTETINPQNPAVLKTYDRDLDTYNLYEDECVDEKTSTAVFTVFKPAPPQELPPPPVTSHTVKEPDKKAEKKEENVSSPKGVKNNGNSSFRTEVDKFDADLKAFEIQFNAWINSVKNFQSGLGNTLSMGEYADNNEDNALSVLNCALPSEVYPDAEAGVKLGNKIYKWADSGILLVFHLWKYYFLLMLEDEFKEKLDKFSKFKPKPHQSYLSNSEIEAFRSLQDRFNLKHKQLTQKKGDVESQISIKGLKLLSKIGAVGIEFLGVAQKEANRVGKATFGIFRSGLAIHSVRKSLEIQRVWNFQLQPEIHVMISNQEDDLTLPASSSSSPKPAYYDVSTFLKKMLECSSLQEVKQMLDSPNISKIDEAVIKKLALEKCSSIEQVHERLKSEFLVLDVKDFLKRLKECESLEEVQSVIDEKSIATIELPSTFDCWQNQMKDSRFRRQLIQSYYSSVGGRPLMETNRILEILKNRATIRHAKVEDALIDVIPKVIAGCDAALDFDGIKKYYAKSHIHIPQLTLPKDKQGTLKLPLETKEAWLACLNSEDVKRALAAQWVDYQETVAQLADQSVRQAILSKLEVENKFLNFRWTQYNLGIISAVLQLFFFWQQMTLKAAASVFELFVTELSKLEIPGIGFVYLCSPFYPNITFKLDALIMLVAEHFFAIKYKPNEYSLKGYKLNLQVRFIELVIWTQYFMAFIKEVFLWLNIRLIENCIIGLEHQPFEHDPRYTKHREAYTEAYKNYDIKSREFKEALLELRRKDAALALSPKGINVPLNDPTFDPIQNLVDSLKDADFEYFPTTIIRSFQDNFGFELSNENKSKLKKNLDDFFALSEEKLTEVYKENRFAYLRTLRDRA